MWPDRVSNPGPLTYESGALPIALRGPAVSFAVEYIKDTFFFRKTPVAVINRDNQTPLQITKIKQ